MSFFLGPMSKNIVDAIIDFSLKHPWQNVVFIPSRRQVDFTGGYVNDWTTETFVKYVKQRNPLILIERDHGGPGQGLNDDDGYESLAEDAKYMDIIHIDPWKKYSGLEEGIDWTVKMIEFCVERNSKLEFEIGTEEAIRKFTTSELEHIITSVKSKLSEEIFKKIKYVVIQCGTSLSEMKNTGMFDKERLIEMVTLTNKYGLLAKEHNGDWVSKEMVKIKKECDLKYINIAPELAGIESSVILEEIKNSKEDYDRIYSLCYNSGKWKKWIAPGFNHELNKDLLILMTLHYLYSSEDFLTVKKKYNDIDQKIHTILYSKLLSFYNVYEVRTECVACRGSQFTPYFENDYTTSLSLGFSDTPSEEVYMPFNVLVCDTCKAVQTKYLGNLSIIYSKNHADYTGSLKLEMRQMFADFITEKNNTNGIMEVGGCDESLSLCLREKIKTTYTIVEPSFTGNSEGITLINDYIENVDITSFPVDTIVMSHIFEHLYKPMEILEKISKSANIKYVYLNHPDFEYNVKNDVYVVLNSEHIYYIEYDVLISYFEKYGFLLEKRYNYDNHSIFLSFKRFTETRLFDEIRLINKNTVKDISNFFRNMQTIVNKLHHIIKETPTKKYYMWPASAHSISLFACGFDTTLLSGLLDNSPNKIGKYLHSYNLYCSSFKEVLENKDPDSCVIVGGAGNYIKDIIIDNPIIQFIKITDLI